MLKQLTPDKVLSAVCDPVDPVALEDARFIVQDIATNGLSALQSHAVRLGDIKQSAEDNSLPTLVLTPDQLEFAYHKLPEEQRNLLQRTADRIKAFAQLQRQSIQCFKHPVDGGVAGQDVAPLTTAGCYAPGGRYPLPSSVLMTAVTARVAGVKNIIVASPRPALATLAAAHIAGADYFLIVGGAQAIAAMAYGIAGLPASDIIVGPGNKWVTAAKSLVYGKCAIDMLAGPSECLVIADKSADPETVASDLIAQAEHDIAAVPILLTTSQELLNNVNAALERQLANLSTGNVARESIQRNGYAVLCPTMEKAVQIANKIAAEHVEIITENAMQVSSKIEHYGALFIGSLAAEVFGDYGAGPNHVLPTGGTAKYVGGLSVHTFLRVRTWMRIDKAEEAQTIVEDAALLARIEGLEGHARAAEQRLLRR